MRTIFLAVAAASVSVSGAVLADTPAATVRMPTMPAPANTFRLRTVNVPASRVFRLGDPQSRLQAGYAGMFDLFPFEGGAFRLSGGSRLFSRTGRWRAIEAEPLRYLQAFRAGSLRASRKFRPALLVGYGRTVDQGLSLGIDAGLVKGRVGTSPDRLGRLSRARLQEIGGRAMRPGMNQVVRATALYRF